MLNAFKAGGKIIYNEFIHNNTPPFRTIADNIPSINTFEANTPSNMLQKNLCIAPKGNEGLEKFSPHNFETGLKPILPATCLYSCNGIISLN